MISHFAYNDISPCDPVAISVTLLEYELSLYQPKNLNPVIVGSFREISEDYTVKLLAL